MNEKKGWLGNQSEKHIERNEDGYQVYSLVQTMEILHKKEVKKC